MELSIIGEVYAVGDVQEIPTRNGSIMKQSLTLKQRRFNRDDGTEYDPNYPTFEFVNKGIERLKGWKIGERVEVFFEVAGVKYEKEGKVKFFNSLRGYNVRRAIFDEAQAPGSPAPETTSKPKVETKAEGTDELPF